MTSGTAKQRPEAQTGPSTPPQSPVLTELRTRAAIQALHSLDCAYADFLDTIKGLIASHPNDASFLSAQFDRVAEMRGRVNEAWHQHYPAASRRLTRLAACCDAMESALDELILWAPDVGDAGLFDTADSLLHDYMSRWPEVPYTDLDYWEELCEKVQTLWESYEDRLRQVGCDFDPLSAEERSYQARMREAEEIKRGEPDV